MAYVWVAGKTCDPNTLCCVKSALKRVPVRAIYQVFSLYFTLQLFTVVAPLGLGGCSCRSCATLLIVDINQVMWCLNCEFADGTVIGVMPEYVCQLTGKTLEEHLATATGYYWIKLVLCILAISPVEKCYCCLF